jgi:hypothetical protein
VPSGISMLKNFAELARHPEEKARLALPRLIAHGHIENLTREVQFFKTVEARTVKTRNSQKSNSLIVYFQ